jgi:hypothetical protein
LGIGVQKHHQGLAVRGVLVVNGQDV